MSNYSNLILLRIITPTGVMFEEEINSIQIKLVDGYASFNYNCLIDHHYCKKAILKIHFADGKYVNYLHGDGLFVIKKETLTFYTDLFVIPNDLKQSKYWKQLINLTTPSLKKWNEYYFAKQQHWLKLIKYLN